MNEPMTKEELYVDGYVGERTRMEINHAESLGKPVVYLEPTAMQKEASKL